MSESKSENSKVIFDGSLLDIKDGMVKYSEKRKSLSQGLQESVGSKTYSSLSKALKDVKKGMDSNESN